MARTREKTNVIDLEKYADQRIRVKFAGGREVVGVLKGFDQLVNLVLDDTTEYLRDPADPYRITDNPRFLGLIVCRGTNITVIYPEDGSSEIENPFLAAGDAE